MREQACGPAGLKRKSEPITLWLNLPTKWSPSLTCANAAGLFLHLPKFTEVSMDFLITAPWELN